MKTGTYTVIDQTENPFGNKEDGRPIKSFDTKEGASEFLKAYERHNSNTYCEIQYKREGEKMVDIDTLVTPEIARKWFETQDQFVFCIELLGISARDRYVDEQVEELESRLDTEYLDNLIEGD